MLYSPWWDRNIEEQDRKQLWRLSERAGGRAAIEATLAARIRSHYDNLDEIAKDVRELGYPGAAAILVERMPRCPPARSGELGEILAIDLVEDYLDFKVPIRRLRYKDGRIFLISRYGTRNAPYLPPLSQSALAADYC